MKITKPCSCQSLALQIKVFFLTIFCNCLTQNKKRAAPQLFLWLTIRQWTKETRWLYFFLVKTVVIVSSNRQSRSRKGLHLLWQGTWQKQTSLLSLTEHLVIRALFASLEYDTNLNYNFDPLGPFWTPTTLLDPIGIFWTPLDPFGPFRTLLALIGPFWNPIGPFRTPQNF